MRTIQFLFYYIRFHKRAPQVLIVSRSIQPRVELRENPTKGMRSIGKKYWSHGHFCLFVCLQ